MTLFRFDLKIIEQLLLDSDSFIHKARLGSLSHSFIPKPQSLYCTLTACLPVVNNAILKAAPEENKNKNDVILHVCNVARYALLVNENILWMKEMRKYLN